MTAKENPLSSPIIEELVSIRKEAKLSQKRLEQLTGIKQQVIGRIETGSSNPQLETLLKILSPFGKTLAIVPKGAQSDNPAESKDQEPSA